MLSAVVVGLLLAVPIGAPAEPTVPGDGLVLAPTPVVRSPIRLPDRGGSSLPGGFGTAVGIAAISGGAILLRARKKRDDEPLFVLVHGNGDHLQTSTSLSIGSESRVIAYRVRLSRRRWRRNFHRGESHSIGGESG